MASPTRWTWIWVNVGSWWWTGRPGVLQFMGSQRVGHDWATELNWMANGVDIFPCGYLLSISLHEIDTSYTNALPVFSFYRWFEGALFIFWINELCHICELWIFSPRLYLAFYFAFWLCCTACGGLVPQPGIKAMPPAVEAWSLNHWTSREVLYPCLLILFMISLDK